MSPAQPDEAALEYAHLLLQLHELDPRGTNESPELDQICDRLDAPWSRMGGRERKRLKGLSQDLYALADGRMGNPMSPEEEQQWREFGSIALRVGDPDVLLEHLRRPFPQSVPVGLIAFLQGRCWERLADLDVALAFMREAGRTIPTALLASLDYLRQLGRVEEARRVAEQLIMNPQLPPAHRYLTAGMLFLLAGEMEPAAARRAHERIVAPLQGIIAAERSTPLAQRESSELELLAARVLAITFYELGDWRRAVSICTEMLQQYPNDPALLVARGTANLGHDQAAAERDFERAVQAQAPSSFPYVILAWFRATQERYLDLLTLCNEALRFPDIPPPIQASLHEWRGIAYAMLRQPREWIEEEFSRAVSLDPANAWRIDRNRQAALDELASGQVSPTRQQRKWSISNPASSVLQFQAGARFPLMISQEIRNRVTSGAYADLLVAANH